MHHIRTSRGTTLFVPAYYNPLFAQDMRSVPSRWLPGLGAWEVADDRVMAAWEIVSARYGLHAICLDCLDEACARVVWLLDTREEATQAFTDQARQHSTRLPTPYRQGPPSTSRELERHVVPAERDAPSKRAAAEALGLTWPTSREDVKRAFKVAVYRSHPLHGGTDEALMAVLWAREVLSAA